MRKLKNRKKIILIFICTAVATSIPVISLYFNTHNEADLSAEFIYAGKNERICFPSCTTFVFKRYYFATSLSENDTAKFFEKYAKKDVIDGYDSTQWAADYTYEQLHFTTTSGKHFDVEYYDSEATSVVIRMMKLKSSEKQNLIGLTQGNYSLVRSLTANTTK